MSHIVPSLIEGNATLWRGERQDRAR